MADKVQVAKRPDNLAGERAPGELSKDVRRVLASVSTCDGECSERKGRVEGGPCASKAVIGHIGRYVVSLGGAKPAKDKTPLLPSAKAEGGPEVRAAAGALGCKSESCVVGHPSLHRFVVRTAGAREGARLKAELKLNYKTPGPRESTRLLSNYNIDGVLQEWASARPDFYNFGFNMMDFERVGGSLARVDVSRILGGGASQDLGERGGRVKRPCRTFACVLNTDVSTGRGKHWVAVFGDCRGRGAWSVEYFNSAGNPPPPPVVRWLENASASLAALRASHPREFGAGPARVEVLTDVRHQDSRTECGVYVLYYIRRRLEGGGPAEFRRKVVKIPDEAMVAFRKHIFRAEG